MQTTKIHVSAWVWQISERISFPLIACALCFVAILVILFIYFRYVVMCHCCWFFSVGFTIFFTALVFFYLFTWFYPFHPFHLHAFVCMCDDAPLFFLFFDDFSDWKHFLYYSWRIDRPRFFFSMGICAACRNCIQLSSHDTITSKSISIV